MSEAREYGALDRFRLIAALLVIAIHTAPLASVDSMADLYLTRVIARVAVPFFFMVSGQFVLQSADRARAFVRKMLWMYGAAILCYLPLGIYAGHYRGIGVLGAARMVFFDGTFYHLWYFPACILGVVLSRFLYRGLGQRGGLIAALILYLIGVFGDNYYGLISGVGTLRVFYDLIFSLSSYTRNGIFFAPLFLLLGNAVGRRRPMAAGVCIGGTLFSLGIMGGEFSLLHRYALQRHDSMYLALPICMIFLYQFLLGIPCRPSRRARTVSLWLYLLHPAVIAAIRPIARLSGTGAHLVENSVLHYIAVCALSVGATIILSCVFDKRTPDPRARAWIELDRSALAANVSALRARLPAGCELMPAIKADAYGHGAVPIAKELQKMSVRAFCVACVDEGVCLRRHGIRGKILILGYTHPSDFGLLVRYRLTQTVLDHAYAVQLSEYGKTVQIHIAVDTGMHRLGERADQIDHLCEIFRMKHLRVTGMYTHLCAQDGDSEREIAYTRAQIKEFYTAIDELKSRGYNPPCPHLLASYGVIRDPGVCGGTYARVGIALYGVLSTASDTAACPIPLSPVLSLKARVAAVKEIYAGECAGYGLAFQCESNRRLAVLAIGYADGLPRALSGCGEVLLHGARAPIVGRICMDQTLVDVTDIPEVHSGDTAVLIGQSGEETIGACDIAERCDTISNEILCRLGHRLPRIVIQTGLS